MQNVWLHKNNNDKLVAFFNGWSMDNNPLSHLSAVKYDVIMFFDHHNPDIETLKTLIPNNYSEIILIGWSMGVWMGQYFKNHFNKVTFSIAINGTLEPINHEYGIPADIFDITIKNFTPENRERFYKRMFSSSKDFKKFKEVQPDREFSNQKKELEFLKEFISKTDLNTANAYDKAIVCKLDKIFPAKNQLNYWRKTGTAYITLDSGHYPFFLWQIWENLLGYAS